MLRSLVVVCAVILGSPAKAEFWTDAQVPEMLVRELSPTQAMEGGQWFRSTDMLQQGTMGLGIIYVHIPGSAGSVSLHAALFAWTAQGWTRTVNVSELFGMSPQDPLFLPDRVEVSTMTLGPSDPRCCPSQLKRWSIDLRSGVASPLN